MEAHYRMNYQQITVLGMKEEVYSLHSIFYFSPYPWKHFIPTDRNEYYQKPYILFLSDIMSNKDNNYSFIIYLRLLKGSLDYLLVNLSILFPFLQYTTCFTLESKNIFCYYQMKFGEYIGDTVIKKYKNHRKLLQLCKSYKDCSNFIVKTYSNKIYENMILTREWKEEGINDCVETDLENEEEYI